MKLLLQNRTKTAAPSNDAPGERWRLVMEAIRSTRSTNGDEDTLTGLLRYAVLALGAERGFLVATQVRAPGQPRVLKSFSLRFDGRALPSMTAVRAALKRARLQVWLDVPGINHLTGAKSIRSMKLRNMMHAPVCSRNDLRVSLLFDTRSPEIYRATEIPELLETFAALFSLFISREEAAERSTPPENGTVAEKPQLVGNSFSFLNVLDTARKFARCDLPVLIQGESGTGKEGISRMIHYYSRRCEGPFMAINCSAFPEALMESELFGAMKGAYTGAMRDSPGLFRQADTGTLLLDEIGDMPLSMQAKLLRVLQERKVRPIGGDGEQPVDVRVLSASHRDLVDLVDSGKFRHDLYWRLACLQLTVPPLRDRMEDLPCLIEHIGKRLSRNIDMKTIDLSDTAMEMLQAYHWPGNVRELESVLARAMMYAVGPVILAGDIDVASPPDEPGSFQRKGETMEESMIRKALESSRGNITTAAARIGWTRQKLYRIMKHYGIKR